MNFIGLVKDSFEAVVQEVESVCQRKPPNDCQTGNETTESAAEIVPQSDSVHSIQEETITTNSETQVAVVKTLAEATVSESAEAQSPADMDGQLQLLADTMRQASIQLSAAAVVGSVQNPDEATSESIAAAEAINELRSEQGELRRLFESRIHSDQVQSRALERLHEELKRSGEQLKRSELAPVLKDIIFCHDFVAKELQHNQAGGEPDWRKSFEMLGQMLLDVLFKYDVEPFSGDSDEFDRTCQQCVKTESTDEPEQDRRIASVGLSGFRNEDRIIRREQVTVFRYRPSG